MKKALLVVALLLVGCNQRNADEKIGNKYDDQITQLTTEIDSLKKEIGFLKLKDMFDSTAYLEPGSNGYSVIKTNQATLVISITDVEQFANGSKVTLQFGNLTSAKIMGLKANIDWGSVGEDGIPVPGKEKSKEVTFNEDLKPGTWTNAKVVLDGTPPSNLGYIRISNVSNNGIWLLTR